MRQKIGGKKSMYEKVPTNMNFVEQRKKIEKFWDDKHIFEKSMDSRKEGPTTPSMTDRLPQTASLISAMC